MDDERADMMAQFMAITSTEADVAVGMLEVVSASFTSCFLPLGSPRPLDAYEFLSRGPLSCVAIVIDPPPRPRRHRTMTLKLL